VLRGIGCAAFAALAGGALSSVGCLTRPTEPMDTHTITNIAEELNQNSITKIDLVLAIDNSRSMADKQQILARAVPDLVEDLVNPRCLDNSGALAAEQPKGPLDPCPTPGTRREFQPVLDIHIGIISSSLGSHGADSCPAMDTVTCPGSVNASNDDQGHLIARTDACGGEDAQTYAGKGFLAWDPKQELSPPGEASLEALGSTLREMVLGTGQIGCGYESQLESWYRFLADPEPYASISVEHGTAVPAGRDDALLAQRADFLRPDSLLAIVMLSDENDCSIKEGGQFYYAAQLHTENGAPYHLPAARAECAVDPNDPCCKSCAQDRGACPEDPTCFDVNGSIRAAPDDDVNLRCFDQKRRFGIDFLYPIDRYTKALTSDKIVNRAGELVPNPIFADLDPGDDLSPRRDPSMVFLAGIVGVPWQDVAVDPKDLTKGLKTAAELHEANSNGVSAWDIILGDPDTYKAPLDPFMIESREPRAGTNPITGDSPSTACDPLSNAINGCEHPAGPSDLQYACTFELPEPVDCSDPSIAACDCKAGGSGNPLCAEDPTNPGHYTLQVRAKAYPGVRELSALKSVGDQGIVASVCARQLTDPEAADYGYRPAIGALVDRLKEKLRGQCFSRTLPRDELGHVPCSIVEAQHAGEAKAGSCNACDAPGRRPIDPARLKVLTGVSGASGCNDGPCDCFCEVEQLSGSALEACQNDLSPAPIDPETGSFANGFCYVDATTTPATGAPELVASCPATERRMIRIVGEEPERSGSTMFITCTIDSEKLN
jgi:hypothetical protein